MSLYDLLVLKEELVKVRQLETDAVYSKGFHTSLLQAVNINEQQYQCFNYGGVEHLAWFDTVQ